MAKKSSTSINSPFKEYLLVLLQNIMGENFQLLQSYLKVDLDLFNLDEQDAMLIASFPGITEKD